MLQVPEEPLSFFDCRIGRNYNPKTGRACTGTRPRKESHFCTPIGGHYWMLIDTMVETINRRMAGWANYFVIGLAGLCVGGQACSRAPAAERATLRLHQIMSKMRLRKRYKKPTWSAFGRPPPTMKRVPPRPPLPPSTPPGA